MYKTNHKPVEVVETEGMKLEDWHNWRMKGIGGSDTAAIYEISPWTTKRALYYTKIGVLKDEMPNPYTLDFGHAIEPFIATWFQRIFDKKYKRWLEGKIGKEISSFNIYKDTMMYSHPKYPFMQANLDYRFRVETTDGEIIQGIFECKSTTFRGALEKWGNDKVPPYYETQCRHYMAIMNVPYTIIACGWGNNENDYAVGFVERNEKLEEELISKEEDFWVNNVLKRVAPPINPNDGEKEMNAFKSFNIENMLKSGELKEISPSESEANDACDTYNALQVEEAKLKAQLKSVENKLKAQKVILLETLAKNNSSELLVNKKYIIKKKDIFTERVDTEKMKEEYPEIFDICKKTTSSSRFTVKCLSE